MGFRRFAVATEMKSIAPTAAGEKKISLYTGSGKAVTAENGTPVSFDYDPENFVYFRCRAISADVPNGNGDFFPEAELKKSYSSFVGVGLYLDHDSDSVSKSIGKVLWAEWVPEGKYVECYCAVDRKLAPDMARRVEMGQASTVSMGCMVGEAICGIESCGNVAHNQLELCEHMMPGRGIKGKKQADGKVAYEINKMLQFTELSLVTVPADPTAKIFEVFAKLQNGSMSVEDFRKFIREEIHAAMSTTTPPVYVLSSGSTNSNLNATTASTFTLPLNVSLLGQPATAGIASTHAAPAEKNAGAVANNQKDMEDKMKLTISYQKGTNLANSFFVAKQDAAEYKIAAADVIPVRVQEAIRAREAGVATPDQICADLLAKCESLAAFKAWAKKRKKKNRKAFEAMKEKMEEKKEEAAATAPATTAAPVAEAPAPAASTEVLNPAPVADAPAAAPAAETENEQAAPAAGPIDGVGVEELQMAIQELQRRLEEKMTSSTSSKKVAVKTESPKGHADGDHGDKAASEPKAIQEVSKTENPKGHMDKGAALKATAAEGNKAEWSINPKEMEAAPKAAKPAQAAPPVVSWEGKEMASEQVKHDQGSHPSKVKQFYGRLPSKGPGEPPKALDPKSSISPEMEKLKKRAEAAEAEAKALKEKERLQQVADKIYEIVKSLRERNCLTAEREDEVIEHLTSSFKDVAQLETVLGLVSKLNASAEAKEPEAAAEGVEVGNVVPQVFEPISQTENAIETMAKIWNL